MINFDANMMVSVYGRIKRSIEGKEGIVLGNDHTIQLQCVERYLSCDNYEVSNFNYKDYTDVEKSLSALSTLPPFAIGSTEYIDRYGVYSNGGFRLYVVYNNCGVSEFVGNVHELSGGNLLQLCKQMPKVDFLNEERDNNFQNEISFDQIGFKIINSKGHECVLADQSNLKIHSVERMSFIKTIEMCIASNFLGHNTGVKIELKFHKLSIYSSAEKRRINTHAATPVHDPSLFIGTVVVCLPSEHTGGDLIVRHCNEMIRFNFADKSADKTKVQFAAFRGECEHEMLPVTSGHKITLTFSILRQVDNSANGSLFSPWNHQVFQKEGIVSRPLNEAETVPQALNAMYETVNRLLDTPVFGLFLGNNYTESGLTAEGLKGTDKLIYDYFAAKGILISLLPVVVDLEYFERHCQYTPDDYGPKDFEISNFMVRTIHVLPDMRREEHKSLPPIPFLSPWGKVGEIVKEMKEYIGEGDDWERIVSTHLTSAMIAGPFPNIPTEGRVTAVHKQVQVEDE